MRKTLIFFLIFFTSTIFAQRLGDDINAFAFALSSQLEDKDNNLVYSPYSIFSNLSLAYFGAKGRTAKEMKSALHLSATGHHFLNTYRRHYKNLTKQVDAGYHFSVASGLFAHQGTHFLIKFKQLAEDTFDAKLQALNFDIKDSALESINKWVNQKTNGTIPFILEKRDIGDSDRLIAVNACYFQGDWVYPFQERMTHSSQFHPSSGDAVSIPFLNQTSFFPYFENDELQLLGMPFKRKEIDQPFIQCVLIRPKKQTIQELEKWLTPSHFNDLLKNTKPQLIAVNIPKFSLGQRLMLKEPLKNLRVRRAFTYQADFSQIDGIKDLFLSDMIHESYFSINEQGAATSAASATQPKPIAAPPQIEPTISFDANTPFLFMLVDYHSKAIIFMGRVMNPKDQMLK